MLMIMKRISALLAASLITIALAAQTTTTDKRILNHLDIGLTAGTTGVGFDLAMPVGNYLDIRAGATFMPHFTKSLHFGVQVGNYDPTMSAAENQELQSHRFERLSSIMYSFTGYELKNNVTMQCEPSFNQFKFMADIHPFKNNHNWHVTAGFYIGNRCIGKSVNTREDMPSLMAVNMYNGMYWKTYYEQDIISYNGMGGQLPPDVTNQLLSYGSISYPIGTFKEDFYATQDMYYDHDVYAKDIYDSEGNLIQPAQYVEDEDDPNFGNYVLLHHKGDVQYHKGDLVYKAGDEYRMTPDEKVSVSAKALVNAFRPYIGIGYGGPVTKDKRTSLSFDLGVMFWGGRPSLVTHDGVDMARDLENVNGQIGRYLDISNHFPVFPVLELRIAHTLF